jgi:hypothetical protein
MFYLNDLKPKKNPKLSSLSFGEGWGEIFKKAVI